MAETPVLPSVNRPLAMEEPDRCQDGDMKSRLIAAWVTATAVAVVLAYQAVGLVQTQVTERPTVLAAATASSTTLTAADLPPIPPTVTVPDNAESRVDAPPASTGPEDGSTESTSTSTTSSTVPEVTSSTSSTSSTSTPTTVTTPPSSVQYVIASGGGTVKVYCAGSNISFGTALQAPGYQYEIHSEGPDEVRVKFEELADDEHEFDVRARCEDGQVIPDIQEED